MGFSVDPQQLYDHGFQLGRYGQRVNQALKATHDVSAYDWHMSYGLICQWFAVGLDPTISAGQNLLVNLAVGYGKAGDELTASAKEYQASDHHALQNMLVLSGDLVAGGLGKGRLIDEKAWSNPEENYLLNPNSKPSALNPFTAGHDGDWSTGLKTAEDAWSIYQNLTNSSKRNWGTVVAATASLDVGRVELFGDPLGTLLRAGCSWALEHIKPLKAMLDGLAGNPTMVKGAANSWKNIGEYLGDIGEQYEPEVNKGTSRWAGAGGTNYRTKTAHNLLDSTKGAAVLGKGMSVVVATTGEMVSLVRSFVRDLISTVVADLIKGGLKRLGFYSGPAEDIAAIAKATDLARYAVNALVTCLQDTLTIVQLLVEMAKTAAKIVPLLNGV
jgi:hypothetical protein